jgi:putative ABC transport system permease protein
LFENISLAFQSIRSHKLRSFLTMLGIIIGIASIITIVSTIKGTNEQIKQSLIGSGNNAVRIRLCQENNEYDFSWSPVPEGVLPVTEETRQELAKIDHVTDVSLYTVRPYSEQVYYGDFSFNGAVYGVDIHYFPTCGYGLRAGRLFTEDDYRTCRKICILDSNAWSGLYSGTDPVGTTLEMSGESFIVVGIVDINTSFEAKIDSVSDYYSFVGSSSGSIFIPSSVWPVLYRFDEPQHVALKAESTDDMTSVGQKASKLLTEAQITASEDNKLSYKGEDLMERAEQLQQLSNSSNKQLLWIAGISLLVGGIGVMNIMLVTVTERTQEIGLKKALGARKNRILSQFLTEAGVLTGLGGLLGVVAGIALARMISTVLGTPTALSISAILISVVFSMLIGIVFGLLPALKASRLDPIVALRRE